MKKNKNEELQSRRQFFKRAAKGTLPILAAAVMASSPLLSQASESAMGCNLGCSGQCSGGCKYTCDYTCDHTCKERCTGGCKTTCSGACDRTSKIY